MAQLMSLAATAVAVFGTAWWAIGLAATSVDPRVPMTFAGLISAISFGVVPLAGPLNVPASVTLGITMVVYQSAIAYAVQHVGPTVQAAINCNVAVILLREVATGAVTVTPELVAIAMTQLFAAASLVLASSSPTLVERAVSTPSSPFAT